MNAKPHGNSQTSVFPNDLSKMASMFIYLANTHMQIPNIESFPLSLSAECGKAKYFSSLICRSMRLRQGVLLLLGCSERRSGTGFHTAAALRMSAKLTNTRAHTLAPATGMSPARWVTSARPRSCQKPSPLPSA